MVLRLRVERRHGIGLWRQTDRPPTSDCPADGERGDHPGVQRSTLQRVAFDPRGFDGQRDDHQDDNEQRNVNLPSSRQV
jgi:hypothetical protein